VSESFANKPTLMGALRILPILWVIACAWPFGGATWWSQQWVSGVSLLALLMLVVLQLFSKRKLSASPSSLLFLLVLAGTGLFSWAQTIPISKLPILSSLPSVSLQERYLASHQGKQTNPSAVTESTALQSPSVSISVDRGHSLAALANIGAAMIAFGIGYWLIGTSANLAFAALALIAFNCSAMAAIGITEDIAATKWQLLEIEKPTAFAAFVSRNSAAMFLNVGIACGLGAIGCRQESKPAVSSDPRYRYATTSIFSRVTAYLEDVAAEISSVKLALAAAIVLMFVGVLVTLSRGGMASAIAAFLVVAGVALFRVRKIEGAMLIGGIIVATVSLVLWLDQLDLVTSRIETVTEGNAVNTDLRWTVWGFAKKATASLWLTGGGLGNFHYAYLPFQDKPVDIWFYHAESFYWQTLVDLGLLGILAILIGIALSLYVIQKLLSQSENKAVQSIALATTFLLASIVLHSFVEFSLFLPAIYLPTCLVLGIAFAMANQSISKKRRRSKRRSRVEKARESVNAKSDSSLMPMFCLAASGFLVLTGMFYNRPRTASETIQAELERWSFEQEQAEIALNAIVAKGEKALKQFPRDGQLNLVMGKVYVEKYRWLSYRMAPTGKAAWDASHPLVARAQFFRRSKQETLNIETLLEDPERAGTLTSAYRCWLMAHHMLPLDWRPHLALAELDFVDFKDQDSEFHLNQLQTLAFNRAKVLTNAAIVALIYPGKDAAFPLFKRAMESSPSQFSTILPIALAQFGSRVVEEPFLPQHAPTLLQIANRLESSNTDPKLSNSNMIDQLWKQIANALPLMPNSDRQKPLIAAELFRREGDLKGEIDSLRSAVIMNPLNAEIRFQFAQALFKDKQFVQAREQINTCIRQQPDKTPFADFRKQLEESLRTGSNRTN